MITKSEFSDFVKEYNEFSNAIDRISEAISPGYYGGCNLFESDWYNAVGQMFDTFVYSHFTEKGADWIFYYMFENIDDKLVTINDEDMFGDKKKEYHLNSIDELWDFLLTDKKLYFKND